MTQYSDIFTFFAAYSLLVGGIGWGLARWYYLWRVKRLRTICDLQRMELRRL